MRMSRLLASLREASAVCTMLVASSELAMAWLSPAIWPRICSEMIRPAGPSAALLILNPEDRRSSDSARLRSAVSRWRTPRMAAMLVLIRNVMVTSFS